MLNYSYYIKQINSAVTDGQTDGQTELLYRPTHSLSAALDQLKVVAISTTSDLTSDLGETNKYPAVLFHVL